MIIIHSVHQKYLNNVMEVITGQQDTYTKTTDIWKLSHTWFWQIGKTNFK